MSKLEQVLKLEPSSELRFRGSFTKVVSTTLKLTNPTEKKICFEVLTTTPKRYCVCPNVGFLEPQGEVEVAITLQPFEYMYDPKELSKHEFMVQTVFAPDGDVDCETVLKEADKSTIMDSKLKCVFDYVEDSESLVDSSRGGNVHETNELLDSIVGENEKLEKGFQSLFKLVQKVTRERNQLKDVNVRLQKELKVLKDANQQECQVGDLTKCPCATEMLAEFKCSICLHTMSQPRQLPCGHCACHDCVKKWLSPVNGNNCPVCRTPASFEETVLNESLKRIIKIAEKCLSANEVEKRKKQEETRSEEPQAVAVATPLTTTDAAGPNTIRGIGNSELLQFTEDEHEEGGLC